jgi:HEAT repeat protein
MDTKSHAWAARISAARCFFLALAVAVVCGGCKTPPKNPFLARHRHEQPPLDEAAAKTAKELADEVEAAFSATASDVRQAAEQTLNDAAERGREVGEHAVAAAQNVATQASATVQTQAIDSLATWPIEQAGPLLLLAIAEGGPTVRRAAARQLAERWPPAAGFSVDSIGQGRAAALAELRNLWVKQYGEINDAVVTAKAHAQQVLDETQQVVADARQVVADARQVAHTAAEGARQVEEVVTSLKQANLPEAARREAVAILYRLAMDARIEVRLRVARAMGELADPAYLPVLMSMLADQVEVQREALASLALVVGSDVTAEGGGAPKSQDERVRRWQLWYQEHPQGGTARR